VRIEAMGMKPRRVSISRVIIGACAVVLVAGASVLYWLPRTKEQSKAALPALSSVAPDELDGWQVEDLPLGATEALSNAAVQALNFDAHVYREYRRGGESFAVYAAYWRAGRMSVQETSGHNPDVCWPADGWTCVASREGYQLGRDTRVLTEGARRCFVMPSGTTKARGVLAFRGRNFERPAFAGTFFGERRLVVAAGVGGHLRAQERSIFCPDIESATDRSTRA